MNLKLKKSEPSRREQVAHRWEDLVDEAKHRLDDLDLESHAEDVRSRVERAKKRAKHEVKPRMKAAAREISETWDDLTDEAHDAKQSLEKWAVPAFKSLRSDLNDTVTRIAVDVGEVTRGEADRIIGAVEEAANERRLEVEEAERKSRVKALIGWTAFGMVAGAVLALRFGPGGQDVLTRDNATADQETPFADWTRDELYARAQELGVNCDSTMDRDELIAALRDDT